MVNTPLPLFRKSLRLSYPTLAALSVGAIVGALSWHPPDWFVLLWLLPLGWGLLHRRRDRIALMLGYYIVALTPVEHAMSAFFAPSGLFTPMAVWLTCTLLLMLPYVCCSFIRQPGVGWVIAVLLTALPPLGIIGLESPLFAATAVFPASGVWGLLATVVFQAGLASWMVRSRWLFPAAGIGVIAVSAVCLVLTATHPQPSLNPRHWSALQTDLGPTPSTTAEWIQRQTTLSRLIDRRLSKLPHGSVLLTPEDITGTWSPFSGLYLAGVARHAKQFHDTVLLGATLPLEHHLVADSLMLLGASQGIVSARQPIPIGEWNPFSSARYRYSLRLWDFGPAMIAGKPAAVVVCYEQMLLWPVVWSWLGGGPAPVVIVAPGNHGWARTAPSIAVIQRNAILSMGRLFGVPVLMADNGPESP